MFFIRLSRMLPLIIALALLAVIVYAVAAALSSPPRAKEILIKLFTLICGLLSLAFGLFSLYALFEQNLAVLDLEGSFFIVAFASLIGVRIANHVFLKHNPSYKKKPSRLR